jgi:uncharacterized protein
MEDIRCAVDYLTTLPTVDEDRIGLLGICAGRSYSLGVAPTEMRAKAIASVSLWDLGMMAREGWPTPYDRTSVLEAIGKQRTSEARGETIRKDPSFLKEKPKNLAQIIEESYDYYRTPRAQHPNSRSVFIFTDFTAHGFQLLRADRNYCAASRLVYRRDGSRHDVHEQGRI